MPVGGTELILRMEEGRLGGRGILEAVVDRRDRSSRRVVKESSGSREDMIDQGAEGEEKVADVGRQGFWKEMLGFDMVVEVDIRDEKKFGSGDEGDGMRAL